ncbi:LLM class F420-dependent oxidoreductase [Sphingobium lactosutens]|uniref:LLM class F420-dependent oxidoreductase n=1 Tax=Sphingobium lactosutens TaxID=522773 RepID=UPI0015BE2AD2|nr:LLM class F420-dependent oxidoreductase [Sphingobium lactosutens]
MKLGVTFPQIEIGDNPQVIREFVQSVEALGYDYLMLYDHVVGADMAVHADWKPRNGGPPIYTKDDMFHEPLTLCGYISAITHRIEMSTGVVILPQRQTVLLAKQAAEIDILSGGRLRLGLGVGWNELEYQALGMNFHDRGKRSEEQIALLRLLWSQESVTFEGRWHKLVGVGINPLPLRKDIPIWLGGAADALLDRVVRLADGWYPPSSLGRDQLAESIAKMRESAALAGRDPETIGVEGIIRLRGRSVADCMEDYRMWRDLGASRLTFNTESSVMWNRLKGGEPSKRNIGMDEAHRLDLIAEFYHHVSTLEA